MSIPCNLKAFKSGGFIVIVCVKAMDAAILRLIYPTPVAPRTASKFSDLLRLKHISSEYII